jgi:hypothetical protein
MRYRMKKGSVEKEIAGMRKLLSVLEKIKYCVVEKENGKCVIKMGKYIVIECPNKPLAMRICEGLSGVIKSERSLIMNSIDTVELAFLGIQKGLFGEGENDESVSCM